MSEQRCHKCKNYIDSGESTHFNICKVLSGCIGCMMTDKEIEECKDFEVDE